MFGGVYMRKIASPQPAILGIRHSAAMSLASPAILFVNEIHLARPQRLTGRTCICGLRTSFNLG